MQEGQGGIYDYGGVSLYKGKDTIIVLPRFQIEGMVEIMDYILTHPYKYTVDDIKQKFDLNEEEYQMIYDFCMPHERHRANEHFWVSHYRSLIASVNLLLQMLKDMKKKTIPVEEMIKKLEDILEKNRIGKQNKNCHAIQNGENDDEPAEEPEEEDST